MTVQFDVGAGLAAGVEIALAVVDPRLVEPLLAAEPAPRRLHLGSEFCETLLPSPAQLNAAIAAAVRRGLDVSLVTPMMSDHGLAALARLLRLLPPGSEVTANDWGTLALLRRDHPELEAVAGRLLCKMVKDPRLPSAEWARLYPHGVHSWPFRALLARLGVRRIELDAPPFAAAEDFRSDSLRVAVHAPYGYSVKGRACKIGSLHQPDDRKFMTGHRCRKECLAWSASLSRSQSGSADLDTVQRGNAVFYRHSADIVEAVRAAAARGWIDRVVLAGDFP